jgi:hypothetical protein
MHNIKCMQQIYMGRWSALYQSIQYPRKIISYQYI